MSRDLAEILAEAVPGDPGGPDLEVIEARATRRRRTVGASVALVAVALVIGLPQLIPEARDLPVIDQAPEASACRATTEGSQVLDGVDLDGDGAGDRVVLETAMEGGQGDLVGCLADGRVVSMPTGRGPDRYRLQPTDLGNIDGVALVDRVAEGDRRSVRLVWLVEGQWRGVSTWYDVMPGGGSSMEVIDYRSSP